VRCIELGATDYLTKPFNPVLLRARVDNCIEKSRYRAQEVTYHERIESERRRADELLATVLPRPIVRALKRGGRLAPRRHEDVAVLFCDVVGFTAYSEKNPPEIVFAELETLIDRFEEIAARHGLEKIKTIGDAFMATANLLSHLDEPVRAVVACALDMLAAAREFRPDWAVRIGIDHGPLSAGIMGRSRPGPWARHNSNSTFGATRSTPPHGSKRPAGRAPSTSAAALGSICATERRAGRWASSTSRARKSWKSSNA
jgi:adenylate cyclase